jgi:putative selenate reductase
MPDLIPASLTTLLKRAHYEPDRQQTIYDLPLDEMYRGSPGLDFSVRFHGLPAGTPLGPAAGPHDQLAQNIVLAWLGGSRIIELKTVQVLDELTVNRPCIDATTVGFNIEWSQELKLQESLREYVKASMIIDILRAENALRIPDVSALPADFYATLFDLSVGYDLAGIQGPAITGYVQQVKDARCLVDEMRSAIPAEYAQYKDYAFRTNLIKTATLSTFHGCPKEEIERICHYLLAELGLHTIIKLNPVQIGKQKLEHILWDRLGYAHLQVNQKAYDSGLSLLEAFDLVKRLEPVAHQHGLNIGVKFSNTLEVINTLGRLPDQVMYLSGQPLHVIAVALLAEWRALAGTHFPVSFAAGIERRNFPNAVAIGVTPVTVCTDLLRPKGYGRQEGYLKDLETQMRKVGARTVDEYVLRARGAGDEVGGDLTQAILRNTRIIAEETLDDSRYSWAQNKKEPRKIDSHLSRFDCVSCDKCVPVCPNDANFVFEVEPARFQYRNYRLTRGRLLPDEPDWFDVSRAHQLANFADFCNQCGNCDTFCPEYGGPFIEKPSFFSSRSAWEGRPSNDGFYLERDGDTKRIVGRIEGRTYRLDVCGSSDTAVFEDGTVELTLQSSTHALREWRVLAAEGAALDPAREPFQHQPDHVVCMKYYFSMQALLNGVLNTARINYLNATHLESEVPSG